MTQQIRRAAASIPANIAESWLCRFPSRQTFQEAEGYGRRSAGDYQRFLNIAIGSANELQTHLLLSQSVGLCTQEEIQQILNFLKEELKMITSLIHKLEAKR